MSDHQILLTEQCGSLGKFVKYSTDNDGNKILRLTESTTLSKSITKVAFDFVREVFLPYGYPDSVSEDYFEYQIWDTVQAFCSTITGTFTTQAILKGVGVGNPEAAPLAAAITWVLKDGTGMIGRIVFAWWKGSSLDADCKKWRLFADILNDGAMTLELLLPTFGSYSWQILCLTTAMKAMVGVAGGATRASVTQHQAIKGNMADVSAKDGSQETLVNLVASIVGVVLLALLHGQCEWILFLMFTVIHLLANYYAVKSLVFRNLNTTRLTLVLQTYLKLDTVLNPFMMNKKESVVLGFGPKINMLCGYDIRMGSSLKHLPTITNGRELRKHIEIFQEKKYLLIPDVNNRIIYISFRKGETAEDVLTAYFHAVVVGIALCHYNNVPLNLETKRQLHHINPVIRLYTCMKALERNSDVIEERLLPVNALKTLNDFVAQEVVMFFTALKFNGWSCDSHSLELGEHRIEWASGEAGEMKKEN